MSVARFLGAVGRACITAGVLILLFVAYQLWGTGIREAQAQDRLEDDFAEVLEEVDRTPSTTTSTTVAGEPVAPPTIPPVPEGEPIAHLVIPKIGVDKIVVEGVSLDDLKKGPGHYPETPLPGQEGNAAIAGHRTTYGAPFNRIDELVPGDEIMVETLQGEFSYRVREQLVVSPSQVEVLVDTEANQLTLTACHPKYSARERIVVVAELTADQAALPRPTREEGAEPPPATTLDDIDGEGAPALPAILLGVLAAAIWLLAWVLGRVWRKWPAYVLGFPFFMVALFLFFEEFARLLPSNF